MKLELLESRLAPATFTYTDIDGDRVTVQTSKGDANALAATLWFDNNVATARRQLQLIDFSSMPVFRGTDLTITAERTDAGGDGHANVGFIDASDTNGGKAMDLGKINIDGDLCRIEAGTGTPGVPAIQSLTVQSMGAFGFSTQAPIDASLRSHIDGAVGKWIVRSDIVGCWISTNGTVGSLSVGGSLIGNDYIRSGAIFARNIGSMRIGGDIRGAGSDSATVNADVIGSVTIGGDIRGGYYSNSGVIEARLIGRLTIAGSIVGGSDEVSGAIISHQRLAKASIGGSIIGGSKTLSGVVEVVDLGSLTVGGSIVGGDGSGNADLEYSGAVVGYHMGNIVVNGSIRAGVNRTTGTYLGNGAILSDGDIGSVTVRGSVLGNRLGAGATATISAAGRRAQPSTGSDIAIRKITVGGDVQFAAIYAGLNASLGGVNADAQIGSVIVHGDWIASSMFAGTDSVDGYGGNLNDRKQIGDYGYGPVKDAPNIQSNIGQVVIDGQAYGTPDSVNNADHFGFVSELIGSFTIGGVKIALKPGANNDILQDGKAIGATGDLTILEVRP